MIPLLDIPNPTYINYIMILLECRPHDPPGALKRYGGLEDSGFGSPKRCLVPFIERAGLMPPGTWSRIASMQNRPSWQAWVATYYYWSFLINLCVCVYIYIRIVGVVIGYTVY